MRSWRFCARTVVMLVIPSTKQMASRMLDLPLPFRPVMELNASSLHCAISQVLHFHRSFRNDESDFCLNEDCVPSRDHRTHGVRFEALPGISARAVSDAMRLTSMTISVILMVPERRSA